MSEECLGNESKVDGFSISLRESVGKMKCSCSHNNMYREMEIISLVCAREWACLDVWKGKLYTVLGCIHTNLYILDQRRSYQILPYRGPDW